MRREKRRKWGKGEERKWGRGEWGAGEERERSGEVLGRDVRKTSDMSRKASSSFSSLYVCSEHPFRLPTGCCAF